jgi:hypothetical protein
VRFAFIGIFKYFELFINCKTKKEGDEVHYARGVELICKEVTKGRGFIQNCVKYF